MKTKLFMMLAFFSFFMISCQLEETIETIEQEQLLPTNEDNPEDSTGNTGRIQCFGQPTCSGALFLYTLDRNRNILIMYEDPSGLPRFKYVSYGKPLNLEVKLYLDSSSNLYYYRIWFKNKHVPEPGMEYQEEFHPDTLDGTANFLVGWEYEYPLY